MKATDPLAKNVHTSIHYCLYSVVLEPQEAQLGALDCTFPWCFCPLHTHVPCLALYSVRPISLLELLVWAVPSPVKHGSRPREELCPTSQSMNGEGRPRARVGDSLDHLGLKCPGSSQGPRVSVLKSPSWVAVSQALTKNPIILCGL